MSADANDLISQKKPCETEDTLAQILHKAISGGMLQKLILSRPVDRTVKRAEGRLFDKKGERFLQLETFFRDGKARHENIPAEKAAEALLPLLLSDYRQTDLFTNVGSCELLISQKGRRTLRGGETLFHALGKQETDPNAALTGEGDGALTGGAHDHEKKYLLSGKNAAAFLMKLGVCDAKGRVFDKKRPKYRQINRFLEILEDVYSSLPGEGTLHVFDLCCGKSYLTFAVYYYLTEVKGRQVEMVGVDRKADVMEFCRRTAAELQLSGMRFLTMDLSDFHPDVPPHLVISLHACDIATDLVLAAAVSLRAGVILSVPCCHHEMMRQLRCDALSFLTEHSILKQKLCDAATDALRAKLLEAVGYSVTAMELIDPEETPKNVLLRAVKRKPAASFHRQDMALREYTDAAAFLGVRPTLETLLYKNGILKHTHNPTDEEETQKWSLGKDFMPFG